jgi:hypothetical protein
MAVQVNYLLDKGGFVERPDGTFEVDFSKIKAAVRDLDHDLLTLEATGDYAGAKRILDQLGGDPTRHAEAFEWPRRHSRGHRADLRDRERFG